MLKAPLISVRLPTNQIYFYKTDCEDPYSVYLVKYQLFTMKILSTYIELMNPNNISLLVFWDKVLDNKWYQS